MRIQALALIAPLLFCSPASTSAQTTSSDTIAITAVPSTFSPNAIVLHVGRTTTLHFSNTQGVHAIASSELGIPNTVLAAGKDVDVAVTPKRAGTYVLHCQIVCGADHDTMTLTVTVAS